MFFKGWQVAQCKGPGFNIQEPKKKKETKVTALKIWYKTQVVYIKCV